MFFNNNLVSGGTLSPHYTAVNSPSIDVHARCGSVGLENSLKG